MIDAAKAAERRPSVEQMCRDLLGQATIDGVIDYHGEPDNIPATNLTGMANLLATYFANLVRHQKREADAQLADARRDTEAGERFKAFVHSYLDQHGVPHGDPENVHQKEGCRIGARLDLLFAQRDDARRDRERLAAALAPFAREADARPWITNLSDKSGMDEMNIGGSSLTNGDLRAARAALAADAAGG